MIILKFKNWNNTMKWDGLVVEKFRPVKDLKEILKFRNII